MARVRRNAGVAYDAFTGFKTQGRKLKQDFYTRLYTEDPDQQHPQDMPVIPGPDGRGWMPGLPTTDAVSAFHTWQASYWPSNAETPRMALSVGYFEPVMPIHIVVLLPPLQLLPPTITPPAAVVVGPNEIPITADVNATWGTVGAWGAQTWGGV